MCMPASFSQEISSNISNLQTSYLFTIEHLHHRRMRSFTAEVAVVIFALCCSTLLLPTVESYGNDFDPFRLGRSLGSRDTRDYSRRWPGRYHGSKEFVSQLPYPQHRNLPHVAARVDEPAPISSKLQYLETRVYGTLVELQKLREDLRRECKDSSKRICLQMRK